MKTWFVRNLLGKLLFVSMMLGIFVRSTLADGPFDFSTNPSESKAESAGWLPEFKVPDIPGAISRAAGSVKKTTDNVAMKTGKAWDGATRSTKQAWRRTTEIMDPFPEKKANSESGSFWQGSSNKPSKPPKKSSEGGFFSWFGGNKPVDEKPSTIQDFLRQERPQ